MPEVPEFSTSLSDLVTGFHTGTNPSSECCIHIVPPVNMLALSKRASQELQDKIWAAHTSDNNEYP